MPRLTRHYHAGTTTAESTEQAAQRLAGSATRKSLKRDAKAMREMAELLAGTDADGAKRLRREAALRDTARRYATWF